MAAAAPSPAGRIAACVPVERGLVRNWAWVRALVLVGILGACRFGFDDEPLDARRDGGAVADATRTAPPGDAGVCVDSLCTAAGGSCVAGACELVAIDERFTACPAGMPCRLICEGYRFCRDGASCAETSWCEVACIGYRACQYGVDCAGAQCDVTCNGDEACEDGIRVDPGGTCTSSCCGLDACALGVATCDSDAICD